MDAEKGKRYVMELANDALYSGTSDEGPSEIGMISLQRTLVLANIVGCHQELITRKTETTRGREVKTPHCSSI